MTVLVGYLAGKCDHAPLNLAIEAARVLATRLVVVAVVPQPWTIPSPARIDAEFAAYAEKLAADSEREARSHLDGLGCGIDVSFLQVANRTAGRGLLEAIEQTGADVLVVGPSSDGALGRVVLGSTSDCLLHASPVPVAIPPRGYRLSKTGLARITCAYSGTSESAQTVQRVATLAKGRRVALRVVSFAVRGHTMYPPSVGLHTEDSILQTWVKQLREMQAKLKTDGIVSEDVELEVAAGDGWDQALGATEWEDGDLLVLGTTSHRLIKSVFLGSHGAKIIRYSPVPVVVLPG